MINKNLKLGAKAVSINQWIGKICKGSCNKMWSCILIYSVHTLRLLCLDKSPYFSNRGIKSLIIWGGWGAIKSSRSDNMVRSQFDPERWHPIMKNTWEVVDASSVFLGSEMGLVSLSHSNSCCSGTDLCRSSLLPLLRDIMLVVDIDARVDSPAEISKIYEDGFLWRESVAL